MNILSATLTYLIKYFLSLIQSSSSMAHVNIKNEKGYAMCGLKVCMAVWLCCYNQIVVRVVCLCSVYYLCIMFGYC